MSGKVLDMGDKLICSYMMTGQKLQIWERPDRSRYTIDADTQQLVVERQPKYQPTVHGSTGVGTVHGTTHTGWTGKYACKHRPDKPVAVGDFHVYPFSYSDSREKDLLPMNYIYALTGSLYARLYHEGFKGLVFGVACPDGDMLPVAVTRQISEIVKNKTKGGKKVGFYCLGGHGRTGTLLASLIAIEEQPEDPIAVARERYCQYAVESEKQAKFVFDLLGKPMPKIYKRPVYASTPTATENYGFTWWEKHHLTKLPRWFQDAVYMDMPFLRELDAAVRDHYGGNFERVPPLVGSVFTRIPGIAPAQEANTFWMVDKVTGAACRVAFHSKVHVEGRILEVVEKLPIEERPYVALTGEPAIVLPSDDIVAAMCGD